MPKVELVLNPRARRLSEGSRLRRAIVERAEQGGALVHEPADLAALTEVAMQIATRAPDVVLFAGGDGTLMRGLSALVTAFDRTPLPVVGVLPAGTVGTVARSFGLRGPAAARAVLGAAFALDPGAIVAMPTIRVRTDSAGPAASVLATEHVGFIFGAGLVAHFFDVYRTQPRPGLATAARIAARVFIGSFVGSSLARQILAPIACSIAVDGQPHPARAWSLLVASRVRDLGLHFLVTYRGSAALDRFHVVASGLPAAALGPQLFRVLAGRPLRGEPRIDSLARALRVQFHDGRGAYVLDGDVFTAREALVENGPVVRILLPQSARGAAESRPAS